MTYLPPFQWSRYYVARDGRIMSYANKIAIFITMHILSYGKIDKIEGSMEYILCGCGGKFTER